MGIFDRGAAADLAGAFDRKKGQAKLSPGLGQVTRLAVAAATPEVTAVSGYVNLKGTALFNSFVPEPVSAPSAYMVRVVNDNAVAPSPVLATRFMDPNHVRAPAPVILMTAPVPVPAPVAEVALAPQFVAVSVPAPAPVPAPVAAAPVSVPAPTPVAAEPVAVSVPAAPEQAAVPGKRAVLGLKNKDAVAALVRTFAKPSTPAAPSVKAEVNMAALPRPKSGKTLKANFRVERVDMSSAPSLRADSSIEEAAAVYQAEKRRMESPSTRERPRIVNPLHDKAMADFKRGMIEMGLAPVEQAAPVITTPVPAALAATCRNEYNMASAGVPRAVEAMRSAAPAQPQRQTPRPQQYRLAG